MKLSEMTPCAICGEMIAPLFYRVKVEQIMIDSTAANQVLGLTTMFGGALGLAEAMAPNDDVTMTLQSNSGLVCDECFYDSSLALRILFREDIPEDGNG